MGLERGSPPIIYFPLAIFRLVPRFSVPSFWMHAPESVVVIEVKEPELTMEAWESASMVNRGETSPETATAFKLGVPDAFCPFRSSVTPSGMVSAPVMVAVCHSLTVLPEPALRSASSRVSYFLEVPPWISSNPVVTTRSEAVRDRVG